MITHTNRFGKTYYLKVGRTKAGKPKYFCSMKAAGANAESIPEGFEIHEDVNGGVFFRKLRPCRIKAEEIELAAAALKNDLID